MSSPSIRIANDKWRGQGHETHLKFPGPNDTSGTAEARVVKFSILVD